MEFAAPAQQELDEVAELNGLFLRLLQDAGAPDQAAMGFPREQRRALARLDAAALDRIARVPRCLFVIGVEHRDGPPAALPVNTWQMRRTAFALAALYAAWTAARRCNAAARTLFGLPTGSVQTLRILTVADLVTCAGNGEALACAFGAMPAMWAELLAAPHRPLHREVILSLIAAGRTMPALGPPVAVAVSQ